MQEHENAVKLHGQPLTLVGPQLGPGDEAPDFTVVANDLTPVRFREHYKGKLCVISAVPSLDTSVCSIETGRFNKEALRMGKDVAVLTISMDLPFAQKRWCDANEVRDLLTLSDYKDASFGLAYGVLIKELRLLARCVFVVGVDGRITYKQMLKDVGNEPDYDAVLEAVRKTQSKHAA